MIGKSQQVAGCGCGTAGYMDGIGANAAFSTIMGISMSTSGGSMYVTDSNQAIRMVTSSGIQSIKSTAGI